MNCAANKRRSNRICSYISYILYKRKAYSHLYPRPDCCKPVPVLCTAKIYELHEVHRWFVRAPLDSRIPNRATIVIGDFSIGGNRADPLLLPPSVVMLFVHSIPISFCSALPRCTNKGKEICHRHRTLLAKAATPAASNPTDVYPLQRKSKKTRQVLIPQLVIGRPSSS